MARDNGGIIGPANNPTSDTASGVWDLPAQYQAISGGNWPPIPTIAANSLRFNDGSSDYLNRTFSSSPTNRKIFTFSTWVKRGELSDYQTLIGADVGSGLRDTIRFNNNDVIHIFFNEVASASLITTQVFRDVSSWYHIVMAVDTTQATASNRIKLYVNGEQVTSFSTASYPSQNYDPSMNYGVVHNIGKDFLYTEYFDGYMSEVVFIDGQQLDPTSFGQFNANGIWTPIPIGIGSFGTNGFHLKFENSASLGLDSSPNGNNWTVNNLTSIDQTTDITTNNFCTANPLAKGSDIVLAEGNTSITRSTASWNSCMATIMVDTGKWYWEQKVSSLGIINCGITKSTQDGTSHSSVDAGRIMYSSNGTIYTEGFAGVGDIATGTTFTTNDIIGIVLDCDAGTIAFYKNGTLVYTVSDSEISTVELSPAWGLYSATWLVNFGNPAFTISSSNTDDAGYGNFEYSTNNGYALCTKNLATYG